MKTTSCPECGDMISAYAKQCVCGWGKASAGAKGKVVIDTRCSLCGKEGEINISGNQASRNYLCSDHYYERLRHTGKLNWRDQRVEAMIKRNLEIKARRTPTGQ
jgi:hypothetical protein